MRLDFMAILLLAFLVVPSPAFQVQQRPVRCGTTSSCTTAIASTKLTIDISENAARDLGTMDEWATQYGVQKADGFTITSEDGSDYSVMTTQDVARDTPVLFVPSGMILSSTAARQELYGPGLETAENLLQRLETDECRSEFALFLKLLVEYEKGEDSPWFPWLNSMPRVYYNGASMTPFCYECLPPLVATLAMNERVKFINFNEALKRVDCLSEQTKKNKDLARWAFQIVTTRSFEVDGEHRIVPMADMLNHGTETEVFISYDDEGNCYGVSLKDIPAGSPLRMSYGDPTNPSYFFAKYGFLDETSPATFCKIMLTPSSKLVDMGYDYSKMLFFKETGQASQEVWDVLLYKYLESADRNTQSAFYEAHMSGDEDTKQAMHQHYYPQTAAALAKHVDSFLKQLDELSQKAVGKDFNQHPRLPLILRHNEFVKETFLAVKSQL